MYYYKFDDDNLVHTLIADAKPDGYIDFGEMVDWTKKRYVDGVLGDIPQPELPPPYVPTLEEVKEQRKEYIKYKRNQAEAATPFEYDGSLFDYDSLSRERINSAVIGSTIAAVGGVPISTVVATWRLYDNSERDMKVSDFLAFKQAEIARSGICHAKATQLKEDIDNATTVDGVNAIDW